MSWIKCDSCDDYWCTQHEEHAYDCRCPGIEEWYEEGLDPYEGDDFPEELIEDEETSDWDLLFDCC